MLMNCGLNQTGLVLAAVSGGADSLALLHVLRRAGYPLLVGHFNHRLRPEADSDAAHVRQVAEQMGLPFVSDSADVAAHAAAQGLSIEEAARELRYRFLFRQARLAGAQAVATGHTADDQAETVLMHFLRGAGLAGLKGMPPRVILPVFDPEIPLVRPLLAWTRAQTEAYCHEHGLAYRVDATNADTAYFRNRLRHELFPVLAQYNPQVRQALARTALALQGDHELLNELLESAWACAFSESGPGFMAFDLPALREMSPALRRNLFRRAAFALNPGLRDVDFDALQRAASLRPAHLAGGLQTICEGQRLYLTADPASLPADVPQISRDYALTAGAQQLQLPDGWLFCCQSLPAEQAPPRLGRWPADPFTAWLDADLAADRLRLGPFRAGDRFEPLGMPGQMQKLSDLFVNLKIPLRLRKKWPVLWAGEQIAWVAGLRLSEKFKIRPETRQVLKIWFERM
jgi:tRNA(Ile)-lysidine synthase